MRNNEISRHALASCFSDTQHTGYYNRTDKADDSRNQVRCSTSCQSSKLLLSRHLSVISAELIIPTHFTRR